MTHTYFRSAALALLLLAGSAPAFASGGGEKPKAPAGAATNPESVTINQRNPQVIHAGPGKPTVGDTYAPAGAAKEKKSGGH